MVFYQIHVLVFLFLFGVNLVLGEDGCKELVFLQCEKNKTFTGHVIKTIRILEPGLETCQHQCFLEDKCISYNLGRIEQQIRSCELSDADHVTHHGDVIASKGSEYCAIKNPCSSNPCPVSIHCTPDFYWNTFKCGQDGGWSDWSKWSPCFLPSCPQNRSRNCSNPAPQCTGAKCSGVRLETRACQVLQTDTTGCQSPLGMENRRIPDSQITASSHAQPSTLLHSAKQGRLNNRKTQTGIGGWVAGSRTPGAEFLQVDLGSVKTVTKVATQGRPSSYWPQFVTKYTLAYSNDSTTWKHYEGDCVKELPGNSDQYTAVSNDLLVPIIARYIRIIVQAYSQAPTLRLELYGCPPP